MIIFDNGIFDENRVSLTITRNYHSECIIITTTDDLDFDDDDDDGGSDRISPPVDR